MEPQDWQEERKRAFRRVMREHGVPPKRSEVALRIFWGYSYKGAAHSLHVSVNAVKHQVGPLFETFEVHDRESFLKKVARLMGEDPP